MYKRQDPTNHPSGQVIEVRAAAFDKDGTRSDVVRQFYVFANPLGNAAYTAQYSGISATVDGITAIAVTQSPNYDDKYYITSLTLDKEHSERTQTFSPSCSAALISRRPPKALSRSRGTSKRAKLSSQPCRRH